MPMFRSTKTPQSPFKPPVQRVRSPRTWQITIGLPQTVILLGLTLGSLACSYYLGFAAGEHVGLENALTASAASVAKMPIIPPLPQAEEGDDGTSDMLAKLDLEKVHSAPEPEKKDENGKKEVPQVEPIQVAQVEQPIQPPSVQRGPAEQISENDPIKGFDDSFSRGQERIQERPSKKESIEVAALTRSHEKSKELVKEKNREVPVKGENGEAFTLKLEGESKNKNLNREVAKTTSQSQPNPNTIKNERPAGSRTGWFAQVAAPKVAADAQSLTQKLKGSGFPVYIEQAEIGGEKFYRVLVGPEEAKSTADQLLAQLKRESYIRGTPFLRNIK